LDEEIRELERAARASNDPFVWLAYLNALIRAGLREQAIAAIEEMARRFPELWRLREIAELIRKSGAEWLRRKWAFDLEKLFEEFPWLRHFLKVVQNGASVLGPIIIGLFEVLFIFAVGLLLPAIKMGELTLSDDKDRDKWFELIISLYRQHVKDRAAYRDGTGTKTRTQLLEDADYLWKLVQAFLRRYPDYDQASILRMIERAAGGWVRQYLGWDDGSLQPLPPVAPGPPPTPVPPIVPPPAPHPHTVERPQTYEEWLAAQKKADAQRIRDRIIEVRKRLRELKRKRQDPNYEPVGSTLDEYINQLLEELAKLRKQLEDMKEDTGEEFDEPYDPLPPAPLPPWPLGHNWANPYRLYVDPKTGKQAWMSDPPPGGDWERMDGDDGQPRFHWGWVPEVDQETGKIVWKPGWLPGPPSTPPYQGTLVLPK